MEFTGRKFRAIRDHRWGLVKGAIYEEVAGKHPNLGKGSGDPLHGSCRTVLVYVPGNTGNSTDGCGLWWDSLDEYFELVEEKTEAIESSAILGEREEGDVEHEQSEDVSRNHY